jgi:hypothetical protein
VSLFEIFQAAQLLSQHAVQPEVIGDVARGGISKQWWNVFIFEAFGVDEGGSDAAPKQTATRLCNVLSIG